MWKTSPKRAGGRGGGQGREMSPGLMCPGICPLRDPCKPRGGLGGGNEWQQQLRVPRAPLAAGLSFVSTQNDSMCQSVLTVSMKETRPSPNRLTLPAGCYGERRQARASPPKRQGNVFFPDGLRQGRERCKGKQRHKGKTEKQRKEKRSERKRMVGCSVQREERNRKRTHL